MMNDGLRPASTSTSASIDDVVVLPCVPDTAMHRRVAAIAPRISARRATANTAVRGRDDLGVARRDRGRHRHEFGAVDQRGVVTDVDVDATRLGAGSRLPDSLRSLPDTVWPIAASTLAIALMPGAADADDVDPPRPREIQDVSHARAPRRGRRPGRRRRGAHWPASPRAIASRRVGSSSMAHSSSSSRSAVSSSSGTRTAAPDVGQHAGVGRLVVARRDRQRHEHGRHTERGELRDAATGAGHGDVGGREQQVDVVLVLDDLVHECTVVGGAGYRH